MSGVGEVKDGRDLGAFIPSQLDDYPLDPYEFRVYARIVRRASGKANTRGHDESTAAIARDIGCSARMVRYALALLVQAGLVRKQARVGQGGTDRYDLTPASEWADGEALAAMRKQIRSTKSKAKDVLASEPETPDVAPDAAAHDAARQDVPRQEVPRGTECQGDRHQVPVGAAPGAAKGFPEGHPSRSVPASPGDDVATDDPPHAGVLMAEHLDALKAAGRKRPPGAVVGQTSRLVKQLLDEDIPPDDVRGALALLRAKGTHPATLPSLVEEHRAKSSQPARGSARGAEHAARYRAAAAALEEAERQAGLGGGS